MKRRNVEKQTRVEVIRTVNKNVSGWRPSRVNPPKPSPKPGDLSKGLGREAGGADRRRQKKRERVRNQDDQIVG